MTRREWRDLGIVLGAALALRVALWWVLPRETLVSDEPEYLGAAWWLANGRGFSFYAAWPWLRPPVYLLFLAPFLRLWGLNLLPIRLAQILISLSVPALVYLLGREMFGPRVARTAGWLAALWLPLAVLPHLALAENLFLPLLLAGFYALLRFRQRRGWAWAAAAGLGLGLATLTRGLTIAFLPVAALWMVVAGGGGVGARHLCDLSQYRARADEATPGKPPNRVAKMPRPYAAAVALLLTLAFGAVALPSYAGPYPAALGATILGVRGRAAAGHLARAAAARQAGDREGAWAELQRAQEYRPDGLNPAPTTLVAVAEWQRAGGGAAGALVTLEGVDWYQAALLRGDILRAQGDLAGARREFGAREVAERDALPWAWSHLQPPAGREVDVGGGLDLGLVDGFYAPENEGATTYRWSGAQARLRFPAAGTGRPLTLYLRLRGWRPAGEPPAAVVLSCDGVEVARFTAAQEWQEITAQLPAVPAGGEIVVTLQSTAFFPGPQDLLLTGRLRMLGVMVDRAAARE